MDGDLVGVVDSGPIWMFRKHKFFVAGGAELRIVVVGDKTFARNDSGLHFDRK